MIWEQSNPYIKSSTNTHTFVLHVEPSIVQKMGQEILLENHGKSKDFLNSLHNRSWSQCFSDRNVQTLHGPSCSKQRRISTSYPANFQLPATCHAGGSPEDEPVADQCQDVRRSREVRMVSHNSNFDLSRISFVQSDPRILNLAGLRRRSMPKNCGQAFLHEYTEVDCVCTRVLLVLVWLQFLRAGRAPTDSDKGIVDIWLAVFWNAGINY